MAFDPNAPRKPFVARGSRIARCEGCLMPGVFCLCADKPNISAGSIFWLMTHRNEVYKPTNTGRLILDTVKGSRTFEWSRLEPSAEFLSALEDERFYPVIVFPKDQDYQHRMVDVDEIKASGKTPAFMILDGTWRQARRMFRHSRYLDDLPVFEPSIHAESRYRLRQANESHHLCTAEVAAAVLECMGDEYPADVMNAYFDLFNHQYYSARMRLESSPEVEDARAHLKALLDTLR
jgi:DTW domain-containing protein YfiP